MNNFNERFDLYWGLAPKGTAKHKAGEKAKQFFKEELEIITDGNCNICGSVKIKIRGRYSREPKRSVCPTCIVEKLEYMTQNFNERIGTDNKK